MNAITTPATQAPVVNPQRLISSMRGPRKSYELVNHEVIPMQLDKGQSVYLSFNAIPQTRLLACGEHFDWTPPYRGRPGDHGRKAKDSSSASKLTALVPLLIALHDPWRDMQGGTTVGHIRLARNTHFDFRLLNQKFEDQFREGAALRRSCDEVNKPVHTCLGGPRGAVLYHDEFAIPAFHWMHGERESLPFTYIVDCMEMDLLEQASRDACRQKRELYREGRILNVGKPFGPVVVKVMGNTSFRVDSAGKVFGLEVDGKPRGFIAYKNGVTARVGELIASPELRKALNLPLMPMVESVSVHSIRPLPGAPKEALNTVAKALESASQLPVVRKVLSVERRAKAPTLADVTVEEAPPAEEVVEEVVAPVEETAVEEEAPAVEETPAVTEVEAPSLEPETEKAEDQGVEAEPAVNNLTPELSAKAELLVESLDGKILPEIRDMNNMVLSPAGAKMDMVLALVLVGDPNVLQLTKVAQDVLALVFEICEG